MTDENLNQDQQVLVIEPSYPVKVGSQITRVIVIGCGGTGGYLIPHIARSLSTLGRKVDLILIDGDTVEEKNLKRQNFISPDIGQNKAEVMVNRYTALGIPISFQNKFLAKADELSSLFDAVPGSKLIISCVDNVPTRMLVREAYLKSSSSIYWIDCGNEEFNGQVVLSNNAPGWDHTSIKRGYYPMPDFFDLYPGMLDLVKTEKLPTDLNCAEMAVASPQFGFVNTTAAVLALNYAHSLLVGRPIKSHLVDFSIDNSYSHRSLTESAIHSWGKYFPKMRGIKWLDEAMNKKARPTIAAIPMPVKAVPQPEPIAETKTKDDTKEQLLKALLGNGTNLN